MNYPKRCPECGCSILLVTGAGRKIRNESIPDALKVPTCSGCFEEFFCNSLLSEIEEYNKMSEDSQKCERDVTYNK